MATEMSFYFVVLSLIVELGFGSMPNHAVVARFEHLAEDETFRFYRSCPEHAQLARDNGYWARQSRETAQWS